MFKKLKFNLYYIPAFILLLALVAWLGKYLNWFNTLSIYLFWIGGGAFLILIIIVFINFIFFRNKN